MIWSASTFDGETKFTFTAFGYNISPLNVLQTAIMNKITYFIKIK